MEDLWALEPQFSVSNSQAARIAHTEGRRDGGGSEKGPFIARHETQTPTPPPVLMKRRR